MTSARDQIIRILQSLTDISAAELGRRVGVSRERVRQILKDLGYPTARGKGRPFGPATVAPLTTNARRISKPAGIKIVAEDLLGKGYAIFAPVKAIGACDLIAVDSNGTLSLITICLPGKLGQQASKSRVPAPLRSFHRRCAWLTSGSPVRYDPPFPNKVHPPRSY